MHHSYDPAKVQLGGLCKRGHDHEGTGKSLRYRTTPICVLCEWARKEQRKEATRARRAAAGPPAGLKRCPRCQQTLHVDQFGPNRSEQDGRSTYCRHCFRAINREQYHQFPDRARASARSRRRRNWLSSLLHGSKSSAKVRGLTHAITIEYLRGQWDRQAGKCYWLGVSMLAGSEVCRHPLQASLERLNNAQGYEPGNVVFACWFVNVARGATAAEHFNEVLNALKSIRQ